METCNFTDYLEIVEAQEECASTSLQASETDLHCDPTFTGKIKKENSSPFSPDYLDTAEAQKECASTSLQDSETDLHCDPTFTEKIKKEYSSPSLLRLKLKRKKSSKSLIQQHPTSETYTVSEPNIYEQTRERLIPLKFMKRVAFILCLGTKHVPHSPKGEIFFFEFGGLSEKIDQNMDFFILFSQPGHSPISVVSL